MMVSRLEIQRGNLFDFAKHRESRQWMGRDGQGLLVETWTSCVVLLVGIKKARPVET